jgi:hypothetical protein
MLTASIIGVIILQHPKDSRLQIRSLIRCQFDVLFVNDAHKLNIKWLHELSQWSKWLRVKRPVFVPRKGHHRHISTGGSYSWVRIPELEVDHSFPSSAEAKNAWSFISSAPCVFIIGYLGTLTSVPYDRPVAQKWLRTGSSVTKRRDSCQQAYLEQTNGYQLLRQCPMPFNWK